MRVLLAVIIKEFQQISRDKRMVRMVLIAPIMELVIFGFAANTEVRHIPLVVVDQDRSAASRDLLDRFLASDYFDLSGTLETTRDVESWFVEGKAAMALVIGRQFGREMASGGTPRVQILSDGSNSSVATIGLSYASGIVSAYMQDRVAAIEAGLSAVTPPGAVAPSRLESGIRVEPRVWYNPNLKSRWFYVPAVLAMVLMLMTLILSSMSVVKEKELGTMEQIIVTPIRSWQLIVGKLLPFAVIALIDVFLVTPVAVYFFGVPLRGSFPTLVALSLLFILVMLGFGLFMSTLARNQQQAMMGSIFLIMVPMMYLSGLVFPIENMPEPIQLVTWLIPLRYYTNVLRGVFLKGSGIDVLWPEAVALALSGVLVLTLASLRFRKRLD
jgi:ABC-2 type transport system permease protein